MIKTRLKVLVFAILAPLAFSHGQPAGAAGSASIVFIINSGNPATSISRDDLVEFYEKTRRLWPDGVEIRFIDRAAGSSVRETFVRDVLQRTERDVQLYWFSQKIRSGNRMPIQATSDEMAIEIVRSFEGAIGYVSSSASLAGKGVKPIRVTGLSK